MPNNDTENIYSEKYKEGGGGGGDCVLTRSITSAIDVGGISKDTTFAEGTALTDMWAYLLEPTLYPSYVAPSAALAYQFDSYYEVGATIPARTATVTYDAGAIVIGSTVQNHRGGAATQFAVDTTGADTDYNDTDPSSGTFSVPALTRSTKGQVKIFGTVSFSEGPQPKDSKGNDYGTPLPAGTVSASKTANFIQAFFYGVADSVPIADFTGFTKLVQPKANRTFNFTTNNQYMVVAYDSSYGNLTSILDGNGFEVIGGWTKSTLVVNGFTYNVYTANSPTTDTNAPFTFKF